MEPSLISFFPLLLDQFVDIRPFISLDCLQVLESRNERPDLSDYERYFNHVENYSAYETENEDINIMKIYLYNNVISFDFKNDYVKVENKRMKKVEEIIDERLALYSSSSNCKQIKRFTIDSFSSFDEELETEGCFACSS